MKRGLIAAAALLALAIFALPWVLGAQAKRVYDDALERLQEQGMQVIDSRYRRGWLSSEGSVQIGLPLAGGERLGVETVVLRARSRIFHGPRSLGTTLLPPPVALVDSGLDLMLPPPRPPPLFLTTVVELDGGGSSKIRIPAISHLAEGLDLKTEEGSGRLRFSAGFASIEGSFELPSLSLSTAEGFRIGLLGVRARVNGTRWIGPLHTGEGTLSLERAELYSDKENLLVSRLSLAGKTVPDGGFLDTGLDFRFEGLSLNGISYGTSRVSFSLSRLAGDALASLSESVRKLSADSRDPSLAVVGMAKVLADQSLLLLANDPQLTLDPIEIATPEGKLRGRLSLASRGLTRQAFTRPGAWLDHLVGEGELIIPRPLLLQWMEGWQRGKLGEKVRHRGQESATRRQGFPAESSAAARDRLAFLVRQGWLMDGAKGLRATATLADSLLTVNGKTIPVSTVAAP